MAALVAPVLGGTCLAHSHAMLVRASTHHWSFDFLVGAGLRCEFLLSKW